MIAAYPVAAFTLAVVAGGLCFAFAWFLRSNQIGDLESRLRRRDDEISDLEKQLAKMEGDFASPELLQALHGGAGGAGGSGVVGGQGGRGGDVHALPGGGHLVEGGQGGGGGAPANERGRVLGQITDLYMLSHDGITPEMAAGLQLPPEGYINAQLTKQGAQWRVRNINGPHCETYDLD